MFISSASELIEESSSFQTQSLFGNVRSAWLWTLANLFFHSGRLVMAW